MVAVSQDLGLHRDCSNWNIPEWEKGLRKRLSWAVIMQDKWAALVHGRPSHIYRSDWSVGPLSDQDFPETFADENDEEGSTEVETGRAIFMYMVSLTQILSDILTSCYSGAAEADVIEDQAQATALVLTRAKPLQIRLKEWYASFPQCLSMENVKARKLSSTGSLHLAYWAAELSLHRCIIRTLGDCTDPNVVRICQHAALIRSASAMDVVKALRPEHWSSFWYFASEFNFGLIGLFRVLLATSLATADDITVSMDSLDQYTWTLKMSQKNVRFLHKSIAMIDHGVRNLRLRFLNKKLDERDARRQALTKRSTYISESPSYSTENSHEALASLGSLDPNITANDIAQNPEGSSFFFDTSPMSEDYLGSYSQQVDGTYTSYI
ncbi:MAG: hypothetical protein Q9191_005125 [Dirinaria sp. TL-2023a]